MCEKVEMNGCGERCCWAKISRRISSILLLEKPAMINWYNGVGKGVRIGVGLSTEEGALEP